MKKENFLLYFSTFISGILITMFISALVTYLAISEIQVFFEVWPKNWFYAALVAFPTILFVRPISIKISNKVAFFLYK
jgi:hypothetical protein